MSKNRAHLYWARPQDFPACRWLRFGVFAFSVSAAATLIVRTSHATGGSLGGMTGLVSVPTARTLDDGSFRLGVSFIDKKWAYADRGHSNSTQYSLSLGFLANLELSFRASVVEGSRFLESIDAPKVDRMGSARWRMLQESSWPALAVGVNDVRGTRTHHALYLVGTKTLFESDAKFATSMSLGYGSEALKARRHVLSGAFGGVEMTALHRFGVMLEFDTEKWNSGIRVGIARLNATVALMGLDTLSGGVNWTQSF